MITEHEVIYVLAFAVMVSVVLAESYNDRVHGGGGHRILDEEWSLFCLLYVITHLLVWCCSSLHLVLQFEACPINICCGK